MTSMSGEHRTSPAAKRKPPPKKPQKKRPSSEIRREPPSPASLKAKRPARKPSAKIELLSEESSVEGSLSSDESSGLGRADSREITKRGRIGSDSADEDDEDEAEEEESSSSSSEESAKERRDSPPAKRARIVKSVRRSDDDEADADDEGPSVTKRSKIKKVAVKAMVKLHAEDMSGTNTTFGGLWRETGTASGPADKSGIRALQALNEFSQLLIDKVRAGQTASNQAARAAAPPAAKGKRKKGAPKVVVPGVVKPVQEIEAMSVNGRILVSANESWSVDALDGLKLKGLVSAEAAALARKSPAKVNADFRSRKEAKIALLAIGVADEDAVTKDPRIAKLAGNRVAEVQADPDDDDAFGAITATLREMINEDLPITRGGSTGAAAHMLVSDDHHNRIIAVDAVMNGTGTKNTTHAEQNLILALVKSGHKGEAVVAGGKRPCMVCWMTMRLARKHGFDISFNEHPGGFWDGTTSDGVHAVATALGLSEAQLRADLDEIQQENVGQYVTNTATRTTIHLADLVKAVTNKTHNTDTPSESGSELDFSE